MALPTQEALTEIVEISAAIGKHGIFTRQPVAQHRTAIA